MSRCACVLVAIAACGKASTPSAPPEPVRTAPTEPARTPADAAPLHPLAALEAMARPASCAELPFAASTPVPEASGAAWLAIDGKLALVVVGDSGNDGAYGVVDPETGATGELGKLPRSSDITDDVEGVAVRGDRMYGITSAGWIAVWQRAGKGFALVGKPYPLGPLDLPDDMNNLRAPAGDGMVCNGRAVNCGRNYEGLCLAPAPRGGCVGFAASKADGHLYCLTEEAGKLVVHHDRAIAITRPGALADCAFADDGTLWVGDNTFDLGNVYRVTGWDDPATARPERLGALALGFPEVIAVRGDVIYRMSDMGGAPSLMARFRCTP